LSPVCLLELLWDAGDQINEYLKVSNVKEHTLFREVYGKSESKINIQRKSYITREFQTRALRIRRLFNKRDDIRCNYNNLISLSLFRDSMPFLDNKKYKLTLKEERQLKLLITGDNPEEARKYIDSLKKKYINIKINKNQKLLELEEDRKLFIDLYNEIYLLKINKNDTEVKQYFRDKKIDSKILLDLSKLVSSMTNDEKKVNPSLTRYKEEGKWKLYIESINKIACQNNARLKRRFRRIIPPIKISKMADMFYSISIRLKEENEKEIRGR